MKKDECLASKLPAGNAFAWRRGTVNLDDIRKSAVSAKSGRSASNKGGGAALTALLGKNEGITYV